MSTFDPNPVAGTCEWCGAPNPGVLRVTPDDPEPLFICEPCFLRGLKEAIEIHNARN